MDNAVALVQAYLQVNGYFTITEYPVLEANRTGIEVVTDLDVLAFRFPGAGRLIPSQRRGKDQWLTSVDPMLQCRLGAADMVIGEVKEGRAQLNRGARDRNVLTAVLVRFGCCAQEHVPALVERLIRTGTSDTPAGHQIRLLAFGSSGDNPAGQRYHVITLGHVLEHLQSYLREHWDVLRHAQFKHPAFGFLATLEKATRGNQDAH